MKSYRHLSLSWASPTQSILPYLTSWKSTLILFSIYAWVFPVVSFPQVSPPHPCTRLTLPHPRYMPCLSHSSPFCNWVHTVTNFTSCFRWSSHRPSGKCSILLSETFKWSSLSIPTQIYQILSYRILCIYWYIFSSLPSKPHNKFRYPCIQSVLSLIVSMHVKNSNNKMFSVLKYLCAFLDISVFVVLTRRCVL
jgi:hypothetical protein